MPLISVLMPVYNGLPYLKEALGSILEQTVQDIEVIALDDASTDGSSEYLDVIQDARLRVFHCAKQGYAPLLNRGLRLARAKYGARMDADDISVPHRLERQLKILETTPEVVVCGCQATLIDPEGRPLRPLSYPTSNVLIKYALLSDNPFSHPGTMYRIADVLAVGGYDASLVPSEDYDLWWRLVRRGAFANAPETLLFNRHHPTSISQLRSEEQRRLVGEIKIRHLLDMGLATSREQALLWVEHWREFHSPTSSTLTPAQVGTLLEPPLRYLQFLEATQKAPHTDLAEIRRSLRWDLLGRAERTGWLSKERFQWLRLACAADPGEMTANRITRRALEQAWSWLRKRSFLASFLSVTESRDSSQ
jgi:hypothetical protein